ncbi:hypothetical protein [Bacillus atrophaeus]|uniref:hypothetical protein n=1 Tax=Bacillus atrophaeus TaxID=1452 RepID=UPI00227FE096|nr:hypothetical protein [Bacillus atrophaeus]MCY8466525.1 hypothetical protein [Bacillus atrophaeus]MCY8478984.1 hypothetical protein [Bacillus atrophaeus]
MNLAKEYMKRQGAWEGDFISELSSKYIAGIAYGDLDKEPTYHWDNKNIIWNAVEHWKATGDLKLYQLNIKTMKEEERIERPSVVRMLTIEKSYINKRMSCL